MMDELAGRGITHSRLWTRGIDTAIFRRGLPPHAAMENLPRPIMLLVGRVAIEKNLEAFLGSEVAGTKVVVGDGPALAELKARFPDAVFMGSLSGEELASAYAAADVFVFPSKTDTFGLVMIEALACGVPVAGYPVPGPLDIIGENGRGALDQLTKPVGAVDGVLDSAIARAINCDRQAIGDFGASFTWDNAADQFLDALNFARIEMSRAA